MLCLLKIPQYHLTSLYASYDRHQPQSKIIYLYLPFNGHIVVKSHFLGSTGLLFIFLENKWIRTVECKYLYYLICVLNTVLIKFSNIYILMGSLQCQSSFWGDELFPWKILIINQHISKPLYADFGIFCQRAMIFYLADPL